MSVTLFNDILLFFHIGSASAMMPVHGALVIASFVSASPASAPAEGPLRYLRFKNHHPLSRLTPIWTGRQIPSPVLVKRQAVTRLAARAQLAEDGAAHHL